MHIRSIRWFAFINIVLLIRPATALAQGDGVYAQVADGLGGDGIQFVTKFRISNLGPAPSTEIKQLEIMFFHQNGDPWTIATNLGTSDSFRLDIGSRQTLAIDTTGVASAVTSGYAIVRNTGPSTSYAEDYQVAVTAFYEVRRGGTIMDTISVPASEPTISFVFPAEIDSDHDLHTGFAIVNLAAGPNRVRLGLFHASDTPSVPASEDGSANLTLNAAEQKALFLYPGVFPGARSFKGMVVGKADGPVAILALQQSPTPTGVQYATMVPAYLDALRRNTYVYLREGYSLDADRMISDYMWDQYAIKDPRLYEADVDAPWDLLYEKETVTARRLVPAGGAQFALIGRKTAAEFDRDVTFSSLQELNYGSTPIDMSDGSLNLPSDSTDSNLSFAVRTGLGRYAKVRVGSVVTRGTDKDLTLEIFIYR